MANRENFSIEYESIEDYIKARTVVEEGTGGGGGGGTFNHSELEQLDYASSGHTGFASTEYVDGELLTLANTMNSQVGSIESILGNPKDGTIAKDIENLDTKIITMDTKLQEVLDKFVPQPDAPDPEVPSYIPEKYVLATDADFTGTKNGDFRYTGADEYVIVPYRIKGTVVRSYNMMFYNKAIKGVASYSDKVLDFTNCFYNAGIAGLPLELDYMDTSGAYIFRDLFKGCKASTLDLRNWSTSKVYRMDYIFDGCLAVDIYLTGWDTSRCSTFAYAFNSASVQNLLGLGSWTNENVSNYDRMFYSCKALEIDLSGFDTPLTGSLTTMLSGTHSALVGYAKTIQDADYLNTQSLGKPVSWSFTVKGV